MNDFKLGDEVWFFYTENGIESWGSATVIPKHSLRSLTKGKIVLFSYESKKVHVYVELDTQVVELHWSSHMNYIFESKKSALESFYNELKKAEEEPT